jgi:2-polyprenyl-3-methyl-5-hydroxy-6-metoxy-1,4-benzoquinol methylase
LLGRFAKKEHSGSTASDAALRGPKWPRHSGAWTVLRKRLLAESGLRILDVGYTSPHNINYLTSLGHSIYLADMVHDAWMESWQTGTDEEGNQRWDVEGFLEHTLNFSGRSFDVVLLWTTLDYLPEPMVQPVVTRLYSAMNPGGEVMALFHTRIQGDETAHCRFHVTGENDVEVQLAEQFPIRRAFTNRSIEKLFTGWSGHRQFLAKDSVSEVILTR